VFDEGELRQIREYDEYMRKLTRGPDSDPRFREEIRSILEKNSEIQKWFQQGNDFYHKEFYQPALECYIEVIKLDDSMEEAWFNKGNALFNLEMYKEAVEAYTVVINKNGDDKVAKKNKEIAEEKWKNVGSGA
jgi:tetratricopeptide (TPR) repeat protein